ncbi:UBX domain-containing protein 1 [Aphelenchoides avenae]|nr:UBX domain-containing protein 1 [Aphelenchus avenae]
MKKLKNFIQKKKREAQGFRGDGYSLAGGGPTGTSGSGQPAQQRAAYVPPPNTEDRRLKAEAIAEAAARRLNPEPALSYSQKKIQMQAKRELEEERKRLEAIAVAHSKTEKKQIEVEVDGVPGVLYTCDLFDESFALPKAEMIEQVEQYLRSQLNDEGVEAAVIMIYSLNSAAKYEAAVDTMKKYLQNIVDNPEEPKFRRIRLSNKVFSEKVAAVKGAVEFLRAVGFNDVDVPSENGAVEKYLAFPETTPDHVENLRESILTLESGSGISLKVFRDPKVFRFDPSKPIPKPHIPSDFFDLTTAEVKREQQSRTEQVERLTTLMTSKMRQEGLNRQTYKYTLIRIRFPNNYILQGVFSVHEQLDALREFICKFLEDNFGVFIINDGGVRIDDGKKTLGEYGLAPAAVLHFDWDEETSAQFRNLGKPPTYLASATEVQADHLT